MTFTGKSAHASAAPWEGVNAGDAMAVAQVAIGLLRQQLRPGDQVHGIVTDGGEAANIIPDAVTGRFMCRSTHARRPGARSSPGSMACFEAGALATGAIGRAHRALAPAYSHMESDPDLAGRSTGPTPRPSAGRFALDDERRAPPTLSTDMANVSLAVPTIHPLVGIDAAGAVNHQPEFAAACVTASADAAVVDGALAMAWTAIDAASSPAAARPAAGPSTDLSRAGPTRHRPVSRFSRRAGTPRTPRAARRTPRPGWPCAASATFIGTSRFWVPRAAASTSARAASTADWSRSARTRLVRGDLGPLELGVDGEDLGRLGGPRRRTC